MEEREERREESREEKREKGLSILIRQEEPADYDEVYDLVKASFSTSTSDGEWDYVNDVRKKDTFIPELSLVAVNKKEKIVGQIVLYETDITMPNGRRTELVLSPICVHPDYFRRGIARAMMERAFIIARELGYTAVFLCGDPNFYHKIGFIASYEFGIYHIADGTHSAEYCMALELEKDSLRDIWGTICIQ